MNADKTRKLINNGNIPQGLKVSEIVNHLAETQNPNSLEAHGFLSAKHYRNGNLINDFGLISCRLVTTAFAAYLVDSLQDSTTTPMDDFKYHGTGTGTTAEANTQTALVTEVETRQTGTQIEGASANIYKSVVTVTYTDTRAVTEHGLFSASTAGTMMDRSVFTAINVENLDEVEYTYQLTVNAES